MIIERLEVGAFAENCYVVGCPETHKGVIIDPGDEIPRVTQKVAELELEIEYVLITHAHLDHVKELKALQNQLDVPALMHAKDEFLLKNLPAQAAAFGLTCSGIPEIDRFIEEGDTIQFGKIRFDILETPGHSPGSVTFHDGNVAFVGDVLFAGSIGRTDLPGGNYEVLLDSIRTKILPLGDAVAIYPGHGPETTVAAEKATNPFLI